MRTGDQRCHSVPISDGRIPETGAQILRSRAPSGRRRQSPSSWRRARGWAARGCAARGASSHRALRAPPAGPWLAAVARPRPARAEANPTPSHPYPPPLGYFYFNPRGFVPFLLTRAWTGLQLAQKGRPRERGDAGGRAHGPHPARPRPGARARRRRSLAAAAPPPSPGPGRLAGPRRDGRTAGGGDAGPRRREEDRPLRQDRIRTEASATVLRAGSGLRLEWAF